MKQRLSSVLYVSLIILSLTILTCNKDEPFMSNAEIIGLDASMCVCCGGTEITIDNIINPNGKKYFLTEKLPADFFLGVEPVFPIKVKIDWKIDTLHCSGNYIDITKIARR
jgi:hypothetical protein